MSLWQVLFKDHRGDAQEYFGQPYYFASTERMPSAWHNEVNIEDLLDAAGCPNIEACLWGSLPDTVGSSCVVIFAPQGVLEAWEIGPKPRQR